MSGEQQYPPVREGLTRLYHGGHGPIEESRWFTSSRAYAEGWAEKSGGRVHYVDVPTDHPLIEPEWPDQSIARGFTWNGELPEDLSRLAKPAADAPERSRFGRILDGDVDRAEVRGRDDDRGMER